MIHQLNRVVAAAALALAAGGAAQAFELPVPSGARNIIIAHDAFVDASTWRTVHDILWLKGYTVKVVPMGLHSLHEDDAAVDRLLFAADGPVVLVGHGYGGSVISTAGVTPKVKALVYVAAYVPAVGENINLISNAMPPAVDNLQTQFDGTVIFNAKNFHRDFAADLTENRTNYMVDSQLPASIGALGAGSRVAAWRNKPSYGIVATEDRYITPELQRWMYQRAGSKITEVKASHAVYLSQPEAVAKVIEEAAINAK